MQLPRPESRLSALEALTSLHTARIKELEVDTAESLRELKHDIKHLDEGITGSYKTIGDTFIALGEDLDTVIATMATKDDINQLRQEMKTDIAELKSLMMQLLQQKSGE